jgi:hypothetical protein
MKAQAILTVPYAAAVASGDVAGYIDYPVYDELARA